MSDFVVKRGDDFTLNLQFNDDSTTPVPIDITNWIVYFTMKKSKDDTDANAAVAQRITSHTDPTNGKTTISIGHADMALLFGHYYYDIQYKTDTNLVRTIAIGSIQVTKDVTQSYS